MNLWIPVEFYPLYKIVYGTFGGFPDRKPQKTIFLFKNWFSYKFPYSVVIWVQNLA